MAQNPAELLREQLGEVIPVGGSDADTQFTDEQIAGFLAGNEGNIGRAAYSGWLAKAALYADLVDVSEGNATRAMSDLQDHALKMVKFYEGAGSSLTSGRTRVGRIRRSY